MQENWLNIPYLNGWYQASDMGRIRSLDRVITYSDRRKYFYKGEILKGHISHGYVRYSLHGKTYTGHFLVLSTFDPVEPRPKCINHKNENKTDNRLCNLEWCTYEYNNRYGTARQRQSETRKEKHIGEKPIVQFSLDDIPLKIWNSTKQACNNGYIRESISKCINNLCNRVTACGYKWKFLSDVSLSKEEIEILKNKEPPKPLDGKSVKKKEIVQILPDGTFIKKWNCIKDAEKAGFQYSNISDCINHKQKEHKGYKWMLLSEYEKLNK